MDMSVEELEAADEKLARDKKVVKEANQHSWYQPQNGDLVVLMDGSRYKIQNGTILDNCLKTMRAGEVAKFESLAKEVGGEGVLGLRSVLRLQEHPQWIVVFFGEGKGWDGPRENCESEIIYEEIFASKTTSLCDEILYPENPGEDYNANDIMTRLTGEGDSKIDAEAMDKATLEREEEETKRWRKNAISTTLNFGHGNCPVPWEALRGTRREQRMRFILPTNDAAFLEKKRYCDSNGGGKDIAKQENAQWRVVDIEIGQSFELADISTKKNRGIIKKTHIPGKVGEKSPANLGTHIHCTLTPLGAQSRKVDIEKLGDGSCCEALEQALLRTAKKEKAEIRVSDLSSIANCRFLHPAETVFFIENVEFEEGYQSWKNDEQRLEWAIARKAEAAGIFHNGDVYRAKSRYLSVVTCVRDCHNWSASDDVKEKGKELRTQCRLNVALMSLRIEDYPTVIYLCDEVLAEDPNNSKAVYRRALAKLNTSSPQEALKGFKHACELDPALAKTADVRRKMKEAQDFVQKERKKEKTFLKAMMMGSSPNFDGSQADASSPSNFSGKNVNGSVGGAETKVKKSQKTEKERKKGEEHDSPDSDDNDDDNIFFSNPVMLALAGAFTVGVITFAAVLFFKRKRG